MRLRADMARISLYMCVSSIVTELSNHPQIAHVLVLTPLPGAPLEHELILTMIHKDVIYDVVCIWFCVCSLCL